MKVVELRGGFGLEHLVTAERPEPVPGPGQVLVRMRAASLNYRDILTVRGRYNPKQPLPLIPCSDGAGEIVATGPGVERVKAGDRVATLFAQKWLSGEPTVDKFRSTLGGPLDGVLAEYVVLDAEGVVPVPAHLSDEEAACLPCAGVTAWNAVIGLAHVKSGDTVLIEGTGGVSIFALQFARLIGARVIVTSSSDLKLERARALGAWQTINYRACPEWGREVRRLTDGAGVDLVVDVGGAGTLEQAMSACRFGGQISFIGVLAGQTLEINTIPIVMKRLRIQGVFVGHRESFEHMNRAIEEHQLHPAVSRLFAMDEIRGALEHLASGDHFGKVCIRIGQEPMRTHRGPIRTNGA